MFFESSIRLSVLFSAFLMFFIQPMIAKMVLPLFGGSAFVWLASILFFQIGLLLGYSYAYAISKCASKRIQVIIHFFLLLASLYFVPIAVTNVSTVQAWWPPLAVLGILSVSILLPIVMISATTPLLQHWYASVEHTEFPYKYYAISNIGALSGLILYPLIFEPFLSAHWHVMVYSLLYGLYLLTVMASALYYYHAKKSIQYEATSLQNKRYHPLLWMSLTLLSSALLIAITQYLTENILNLPFLWVMPLALFLVSYIITFSAQNRYQANFWRPAYIIFSILVFSLFQQEVSGGFDLIIAYLTLLFAGCMVCHGELITLKPSNDRLTSFYLYIALGGVLGGVLVNFVAPFVFKGRAEFFGLLVVLYAMTTMLLMKTYYQSKLRWDLLQSLIAVVGLGYLLYVCNLQYQAFKDPFVQSYRSPYGVLKVKTLRYSGHDIQAFFHGSIVHGAEFLVPDKRSEPTTYYARDTGVYQAIRFVRAHATHLNMGAIGLGIGTVAAYGKLGDRIRFYEIDPQVITIAKNEFKFLSNSMADIQTVLGDARISLSKELKKGAHDFNLLIVDAFNGDVIPFHLLTEEAASLYHAHLSQDGVIAFHITNSYVNLIPVIKGLSERLDCPVYFFHNTTHQETLTLQSVWALMSCDARFPEWIRQHAPEYLLPGDAPRYWRDDKNSILPILTY